MYVLVDFLKNMPQFKHWSKNALSKLTYYFERIQYLRNQIVFKEGDQCLKVYIVFDGEFEVQKKMKEQRVND